MCLKVQNGWICDTGEKELNHRIKKQAKFENSAVGN
jgi:hypothetical protein